jgi:vacuolar-type H+-ATPase subunit C/Vma6
MILPPLKDLDYVAARVHGRRSRLAEAGRLDALARSRSFDEFTHAVFPATELATAPAFQRHSVKDLIRELTELRAAVSGAGGRLLEWLLGRFQVENLKVLLRACAAQLPFERCREHLVALPKTLALDGEALVKADSLRNFARLLPRENFFRPVLELALAAESELPLPFFYEAALDRAFLAELLARVGQLNSEDTEAIAAVVRQEADMFHLMLVLRGRFFHGLKREQVLPLHLAGTRLSRARLAAMLGDSDLATAMSRAVGRALDALPQERGPAESEFALEASAVEALAWKRLVRLANRAFRQGHMGLGSVVGYAVLRRAEVANLITLSEGLRLGLAAETLRVRLMPRGEGEVAHV